MTSTQVLLLFHEFPQEVHGRLTFAPPMYCKREKTKTKFKQHFFILNEIDIRHLGLALKCTLIQFPSVQTLSPGPRAEICTLGTWIYVQNNSQAKYCLYLTNFVSSARFSLIFSSHWSLSLFRPLTQAIWAEKWWSSMSRYMDGTVQLHTSGTVYMLGPYISRDGTYTRTVHKSGRYIHQDST